VKVLHAAASVAPRDGGPSTAVLGMNRELSLLGVTSQIVTTDADGPTGRLDGPARSAIQQDGGPVVVCRRSRPHFLKNSWSQGINLLHLPRDTDLVHIHGVYLANSIWTFLAAQLGGTSYVVQPHGTLEPYQRGFGRLKKHLFDRLIGTRILNGAAGVIAASSAEADHLREMLPSATVFTVPLGVTRQTPAIDIVVEQQLADWLAMPRHQRVLFLGRLATKKRPDLLISAWNGTSAGHLLIVGPPQNWSADTLLRLLSPPRQGSVTFLDAVSPAAVAWLMTEAGVFTLPSENENFAISVAEAMTYGCAVVTTRQTAASEHVEAAGAGLLLPYPDVELVRAALATLMSDPLRVAEMGDRGRQYADVELTWTTTAVRLLEAYTHLAPRIPHPRTPPPPNPLP
jgi:glycosyltransferase involved in cell wall biosynthesis